MPMRIALVCPYSLTLPGGVQTQVLALARALRALGHPTRVLGPCDGAPPDVGITTLGKSVPLAANGSMAPLAPHPPCAPPPLRPPPRAPCAPSAPGVTSGSTSSTCTSHSFPAPR